MDIALEQSIASAIRFIQDHTENITEYYFGKIPEKYYLPSVYFQVPFCTGSKATLRSYKQEITFNVWFMAADTWEAHAVANKMMETFMLENCAFPVIERDGTITKKGLRIYEPATRVIEDGIVQLSFNIPVYFYAAETIVERERQIKIAWNKINEQEG